MDPTTPLRIVSDQFMPGVHTKKERCSMQYVEVRRAGVVVLVTTCKCALNPTYSVYKLALYQSPPIRSRLTSPVTSSYYVPRATHWGSA